MPPSTSKTKRVCPECGSEKVIPIVYGEPTPNTMEKAANRMVKLGGCGFDPSSLKWHCNKCRHEWRR